MRYVIMADGKEVRWNNHMGIHKCEIEIGGETLLQRTSRLILQRDEQAELFITTHDPRVKVPRAICCAPQNNYLEVDRFTEELIRQDTCFLYGDVFYTEKAIDDIVDVSVKEVLFFGNERKIFAVKVKDDRLFRHHVARVRDAYRRGEIGECIGWEVYHSLQQMALEGREIGKNFFFICDETRDFNTPQEWEEYSGQAEIR